MKIRKLKISNWRSIKEAEIDLEDLTMFIGQNNHGKSNILSAILFFFNKIQHNTLDFNSSSLLNELYVEITFDRLDGYDKIQFSKYVTSDNSMTVRRTMNKTSNPIYQGYVEIPEDDWLKENLISNYTKKDDHKNLPIKDFLPVQGRITNEMYLSAIKEYITNNRDKVSFSYNLEPTPFLGLASVAQGIFGDIYFIPAVRNAADEFLQNGNSLFSKLLSKLMDNFLYENDKYMEAKLKIQELVQVLNKKTPNGETNLERPSEITQIENKLESELQTWGTFIDIEINPPEIDKIFKVNTTVWIDDGTRTDVNRKGQGLQRSIIFALMKLYAKTLKDEKQDAKNEKDTLKMVSRQKSNSTYFLYEEPELYLHPHAEKELYSSLKELAMSDHNQVILTTHSASFIDIENYKSIVMVKKENLDIGTKTLQCLGNLFDNMEDKKRFNLIYWINPDRSEIFFAKKVILLEGQTEKIVIPYMAQEMNVFRYDYSIIDCGGKGSIPLYISLLNKFQIPYVAVYDKDFQVDKDENAHNAAQKYTNAIESKINPDLGKSIIFENDIEEELGLTDKIEKNKLKANPFLILEKIEKMEIIITNNFRDKIKKIYE